LPRSAPPPGGQTKQHAMASLARLVLDKAALCGLKVSLW
jgi:hypothetical protein